MKCPNCGYKEDFRKVRLNVYKCEVCQKIYLIKELKQMNVNNEHHDTSGWFDETEKEKMTEKVVLTDFVFYLEEKNINKTYLEAVKRWVEEYLEMLK